MAMNASDKHARNEGSFLFIESVFPSCEACAHDLISWWAAQELMLADQKMKEPTPMGRYFQCRRCYGDADQNEAIVHDGLAHLSTPLPDQASP